MLEILMAHIARAEQALITLEDVDGPMSLLGVNNKDRMTTRLQGRLGALYSLRADIAELEEGDGAA